MRTIKIEAEAGVPQPWGSSFDLPVWENRGNRGNVWIVDTGLSIFLPAHLSLNVEQLSEVCVLGHSMNGLPNSKHGQGDYPEGRLFLFVSNFVAKGRVIARATVVESPVAKVRLSLHQSGGGRMVRGDGAKVVGCDHG